MEQTMAHTFGDCIGMWIPYGGFSAPQKIQNHYMVKDVVQLECPKQSKNIGPEMQPIPIYPLQSILSNHEGFFDVPYKELTHSYFNFDANVGTLKISYDEDTPTKHVDVQAQKKTTLCDEFMFGNDADGFLSDFEPINSPHDFSSIESERNVGTVRFSESMKSKVSSVSSSGLVHVPDSCVLRSCDDREMIVPMSDEGKLKRLFCIYCKKTYPKFARHLEDVHKNEADVRSFIDLPKGSKERRKIIDYIRKKGQFEFNANSNYNKGFLQTSRRPNPKWPKEAKDMTLCFNCKGKYTKNYVRHHVKICTGNALGGQRVVLEMGRMVEGRMHQEANAVLGKIIAHMQDDEIVRLIRYDWLLIKFGNNNCPRFIENFQLDIVGRKLRLAGRILQAIKVISPELDDFASIYKPKNYDALIDAIRMVGKYDSVTCHFNSPTTSSDAVTLMKAISNVLIAHYIKEDNGESLRITEMFLKLMNADISTSISKPVINSKARNRLNKEERIPTTADVKLLAQYVDDQRKSWFLKLKDEFSFPAWRKLSEFTMVSIIVFNRRRVGDTQNITVENFENRKSLDGDLYDRLSERDKQIANRFSRMMVRGKKRRKVPCLIKAEIAECLHLLIAHRKNAEIEKDNEFLFALPSTSGFRKRVLDAGDILRKLSVECGAKDPESLRGTTIRKNMASICITMELQDSIVSELADFMGHAEKVHREYYRRNPIERQVIQMSQLLEAALGNCEEDNENEENLFDDVPIADVADFGGSTHSVDLAPIPAENQIVENLSAERKRKNESPIDQGVKQKKKRWNQQEKSDIYRAFPSFFKNKTLPSFDVIKKEQQKYEGLRNRTPGQIKAWMSNRFKKEQ